MAQKRLVIDGYGQLELNNVAFRRDGRIEAQCALDATDFASVPAENGMLLAVDKIAGTVRMPDSSEVCPIALNYTAEHMYDERRNALKDFKLDRKDGFYPRLGYLAIGDKFTTNCVSYDAATDSTWTTEDKFIEALGDIETTKLYGTQSADGSILVSATAPTTGIKLLVIQKTTMPDGQLGVKFQVLGA